MKTLSWLLRISLWLVALGACQSSEEEPAPSNGVPNGNFSEGLNALTQVTDAQGNTYRVGYDQASSINQNPYVEKKDAAGNQIWRHTYESTGVDGRAILIALDESNQPWVAFTVDGGSTDNAYINKKHIESGAFSGVYMNSYGSGGGPKVSVLTRLDPASGKIVKGTFFTTRLDSGKTNSLTVKKIGFKNGRLAIEVESAAWPPGKGTSYQKYPNISDADRFSDNTFKLYYEINKELSEVLEAIIYKE